MVVGLFFGRLRKRSCG